ncbi:MAG: hypothetical protein C4332_09140 [Meiothermus sp.]
MISVEYSVADEFVGSGQARILGVASARRVEDINAPTFLEQGVDVEVANWHGIVAPRTSPRRTGPSSN